MSKNVLVFAEVRDGSLRNVTFEALSAAKKLANGGQVFATVFGSHANQFVKDLVQFGADVVYIVNNPMLNQYTTEAYTQAVNQVINETKPDAILMGHTSIGKDIAPRIAARNGLGLVTDCVNVEVNGEDAVFTRPIYAGKAFQKKRIKEGTQFITIRPNNIPIDSADPNRSEQVVNVNVEIKDIRAVIKGVVKSTTGGIDLTEAKIIVSGGRGVKSADGFKTLNELASVLGAAVGASRGACDQDYSPYAMQIGQTGKVVTPDIYIACGISGAIQHLAGMSNSKIIVAINTDPEAPIFKVADYGIVGDLFEVVPILTEEFKKII